MHVFSTKRFNKNLQQILHYTIEVNSLQAHTFFFMNYRYLTEKIIIWKKTKLTFKSTIIHQGLHGELNVYGIPPAVNIPVCTKSDRFPAKLKRRQMVSRVSADDNVRRTARAMITADDNHYYQNLPHDMI